MRWTGPKNARSGKMSPKVESVSSLLLRSSSRLRSAACTGFNSEYAVLFLCHILTQRPLNDRKIERSDGRGLGRQQLLANSIEISFPMKKTSLVTAQYLQSI